MHLGKQTMKSISTLPAAGDEAKSNQRFKKICRVAKGCQTWSVISNQTLTIFYMNGGRLEAAS